MAYGIKYELFFSDLENKQFKIEILKKGYITDPFGVGTQPAQLVGTGTPCEIIWDADDDIYSPIIGSRCVLNLFVTDAFDYDEFQKSDEREYKVKLLEYASYGNDYNDEELPWEAIDQKWDGKIGATIFYSAIWEGFLVNDGYKEAVITKPFPITLEAYDGLGTISGFKTPFDSTDTAANQNLFYYLRKVLEYTGHEFDIYISNDIRKDGAAANDTIFHDIEVSKYALSNQNLILRDGKDILTSILKMTNSRIFQSYASWYITSNSSIIDNRITQSVAPSGGDSGNVPNEPQPAPVFGSPSIEIIGVSPMIDNTSYSLVVQNTGGTVPTQYVWTYPDSSTVTQTSSDILFGIIYLGLVPLSSDGDVYSVVATDANAQTDNDSFTLDVDARPQETEADQGIVPPDDPDAGTVVPSLPAAPVNYMITITEASSVSNAYVSPSPGTFSYSAGQVGDSFSMTFDLVSLVGEFTSLSNVTSFSVGAGFSVTRQLIGEFIRFTVTGTLPVGGSNAFLKLTGAADVQNFTYTFNMSDSLSNAGLAPSQLVFTGGEGKAYSGTFNVNADSGYQFQGRGDAQLTNSTDIGQSLSNTLVSDTQIQVTVSGTIGISDSSSTITVSGGAISANVGSSITINPSGNIDVAQNGGWFDVSITSNGNFTITPGRNWITTSIANGTASTTTVRVYFTQSNEAADRVGRVNFYASGSNTILASIRINQEGTQ